MYNDDAAAAAAIANQFFAAHNLSTVKMADDFINIVSSSSVRLNIIHYAAAFLNWTYELSNSDKSVDDEVGSLGGNKKQREIWYEKANQHTKLKLVLANNITFLWRKSSSGGDGGGVGSKKKKGKQ